MPADPKSGRRVLCVDLGPVATAEHRYLQCFATGFGPTKDYYQTRNLARYERLHFDLQNCTPAALHGALSVKDYRDSSRQSATFRFELPAGGAAVTIHVPLKLTDPRWTVEGTPDLTRVLTMDFLFEPQTAIRSGQVWLSEISLVEPGGPVDIETSPLAVLVERLARRQWDALWSARSRSHGMIPNNSYQATDAGLNTTAAVLWMLPAATRRAWVPQADADRYVDGLAHTMDGLLDRAKHAAAPQCRLDHAQALALARRVVGRRGLPGPGVLPVQESPLDVAGLAQGHRAGAGPFQFCRLFLPGRMADGLSLSFVAEPGRLRALRVRRLYERRQFDLAGGAPGVRVSRAHRDALEHQHQAGADATGGDPQRRHGPRIQGVPARPSRRPCGISSSMFGSAASIFIRTGAWR